MAYALTFGGLTWGTGKRGARGLLVLHKCDNRRCVNPAHLSDGVIGNPGRGWSRDTRAGRTLSLAAVGQRYGVSGKTIEQVLRRRAWVGVGEPIARE